MSIALHVVLQLLLLAAAQAARLGGHANTLSHASRQRQSVRQLIDMRLRCSVPYRETVAADVASGRARPPLFDLTCDLEQCSAAFINGTLARLRAAPRFASLLPMLPCDLWAALRGRTLWLAGDSQSQRMYRTVRCFLREFLEPTPREAVWDAALARDVSVRRAWRDALVRDFQGGGVELPICTRFVGGARVCHARVNRGPHLQAYLGMLAPLGVGPADIWLFNVAMWYRANETAQYAADMAALAAACSAPRPGWPLLIWRDAAAQHFDAPHGDFPLDGKRLMGKNFTGCKPIEGVELQPDGTLSGTDGYIVQGGWRNQIATPLMRRAGVAILSTWNDSIPLHAGHTAVECTHFCSRGAYGLWVWQLWQLLQRLESRPAGAERQQPASQAASWAVPAGGGAAAAHAGWLGGAEAGRTALSNAYMAHGKTRRDAPWLPVRRLHLAAVPAAAALLAAYKGHWRGRLPAGTLANKAPPLWRAAALCLGRAVAHPRRQLLGWLAWRRQQLALRRLAL